MLTLGTMLSSLFLRTSKSNRRDRHVSSENTLESVTMSRMAVSTRVCWNLGNEKRSVLTQPGDRASRIG